MLFLYSQGYKNRPVSRYYIQLFFPLFFCLYMKKLVTLLLYIYSLLTALKCCNLIHFFRIIIQQFTFERLMMTSTSQF